MSGINDEPCPSFNYYISLLNIQPDYYSLFQLLINVNAKRQMNESSSFGASLTPFLQKGISESVIHELAQVPFRQIACYVSGIA